MTNRIMVINNVSLDGVMQAPGRPDEDERGGFTHGGWAVPYDMGGGMDPTGGGALLFGRRTYQDFAGFWPRQTDGNPFTPVLDASRKYVVSSTLEQDQPWQNTTVLRGIEDVAALDEDLVVLGSGELVRSLLRHGLVDLVILRIHPLVLGSGTRMFADDGFAELQLLDSATTETGVIMATYSCDRKAA